MAVLLEILAHGTAAPPPFGGGDGEQVAAEFAGSVAVELAEDLPSGPPTVIFREGVTPFTGALLLVGLPASKLYSSTLPLLPDL